MPKKVQDKIVSKAVLEDSISTKDNEAVMNANMMSMVHGKNKIDATLIPKSYPFSWEYSLEIQADNEKSMIVDYLLERRSEYFGFKMREAGGVFMVFDSKNKFMITAFSEEKGKMAMAAKMPDYSEITENENKEFSYKALLDKVMMGYRCKGIQANSEDSKMVFYYTNEAKVSFSDLFRAQQKQTNLNALKNYFKAADTPLMMTMSMKDLKNKGAVTTMKCVSLVEKANSFNKSDYVFM